MRNRIFITQNQRLPEMPSAQQVKADGLDLGEVLTLAIKKIEELTLYAIEAKKEREELRREIKNLNRKIGKNEKGKTKEE